MICTQCAAFYAGYTTESSAVVSDVLDLFAAGLSAEQILEELPDLEMEDLKAALTYASRKLNYPVLAA